MPAWELDEAEARRRIAAVELALSEGALPPGTTVWGSRKDVTAVRVAADRLRIGRETLRGQIGTPEHPGRITTRLGLAVDWSKFRRRPPEPEPTPQSVDVATPAPPAPPSDPIDLRRLRDEVHSLRARVKQAERRAAAAENIRAGILGLVEAPAAPVAFPAANKGIGKAETILLFLSDLQWGEHVSLAAMDGLNSYSLEIARRRLGRWMHAAIDLSTKHWVGGKPDRIILVLGGDLVSGALHLDLAKTDEMRPLPAVRDVAEHLRQAILTIRQSLDCSIDVISLAGNHGRTTEKPESKDVATTSLDNLVSDFLELALKGSPGINFFVPASPDALFSIYGFRILCTHGDRIGSRGGQGFVGPAATAARGFKRLVADYAGRGIHLDLILIGHFHTRLLLEEGLVNGTLVGPSEYSRDGRFRPLPAMQWFIAIHPDRGVTQLRPIYVGDPSEGSLYEPPPDDRPLRPRFRVKAITERI